MAYDGLEEGNTEDCFSRNNMTIGITDEFPGLTIWNRTTYCGCKASYVPALGLTFLRHWEVDIVFPIIVGSIICSSFLVYLACVLPSLSVHVAVLGTPILGVLLVLFSYAYFRIIADGPGYLPFYWPVIDSLQDYQSHFANDPDGLYGVVSVDEQYEWVQTRLRPARSVYARSARRFVFRPDHKCAWAASWIGKLNYKFFLLFNFYGVLYCSTFTVLSALGLFPMLVNITTTFSLLMLVIYMAISVSFASMMGFHLGMALWNAGQNVTAWESWNGMDPMKYDRGSFCMNMEDVMGDGPRSRWCCPTSPWTTFSLGAMSAQYGPYDTV